MKTYITFLMTFVLFIVSILPTEASGPPIISREQWGADESYTYKYSDARQRVIDNWPKPQGLTPEQKELQKKQQENYQKSVRYINENFGPQNTITQKITSEDTNTLAWPIQKSDYVNAIVIHHTDTDYKDSFTGMQQIYKYHTLSRAWWDIGYNYVIGYDGEIFEGRKGGDYVTAAHSKWNNISTVSIAIMGNYDEIEINTLQYTSLEVLIQELTSRYGIDLSKDYYYNYQCSGAACNIFPLETHIHKTLVGHRDTGHTNCPGDALYKQIEQIRLDNLEFTKGFTPIKRGSDNTSTSHNISSTTNQKILRALKKLSEKQLVQIGNIIDEKIVSEKNPEKIKLLKIIRIMSKQVLESKISENQE